MGGPKGPPCGRGTVRSFLYSLSSEQPPCYPKREMGDSQEGKNRRLLSSCALSGQRSSARQNGRNAAVPLLCASTAHPDTRGTVPEPPDFRAKNAAVHSDRVGTEPCRGRRPFRGQCRPPADRRRLHSRPGMP